MGSCRGSGQAASGQFVPGGGSPYDTPTERRIWLLLHSSRVAQFPDMVKGLSPPALNLLNFTHFFAPLASHRLFPRRGSPGWAASPAGGSRGHQDAFRDVFCLWKSADISILALKMQKTDAGCLLGPRARIGDKVVGCWSAAPLSPSRRHSLSLILRGRSEVRQTKRMESLRSFAGRNACRATQLEGGAHTNTLTLTFACCGRPLVRCVRVCVCVDV